MKTNINESPLRQYAQIPNYWKPAKRPINYANQESEVHLQDGWRDIDTHSFDSDTQVRTGKIVYDSELDRAFWEVIELTPEELEARRMAQVPYSITPTQGRIMLATMGILDQVNTIMEASEDQAMKIYWEYSLSWDRHSEYILSAANLLGMSEEDLNEFFISASQIV